MAKPAKISILRGPDEGRVFSVEEELVQIGRGAHNDIALSDVALQEHQASIVRRNGRYAIFTPLSEGVEVDGNRLPAEQWIWLPETSKIRFGDSTLFQFRYQPDDDSATPAPTPAPAATSKSEPTTKTEPPSPPKNRQRKSRQKSPPAKKLRKVAKFLTDSTSGDQLVRLGEDGKLPELALSETSKPARAERKPGEKSPLLLYIAVGVSLLLSLAMLFVDTDSGGSTAAERAEARKQIQKFYGKEGDLKPYQRHLREAQRAHSVGDYAAERRAYRRVIEMLNSEDVANSYTGITGDAKGDKELRELIGILMNHRE